MWNLDILKNYILNVIMKRPQTSLLRQPVLFIIDSFAPHINLANSKLFEKFNIFIEIIPAKMTGLLQPLDVCLNRTFQEYYNDNYNTYITKAISDHNMQTKQGNPKVPCYFTVSEWVVAWKNNVEAENLVKAFNCCGIVAKEEFKIQNLHEPRALISDVFDINLWYEKFNNVLSLRDDCFFDTFEKSDYYFPEKITKSFFGCVKYIKSRDEKFEDWIELYIKEIIKFLETHMEDLLDDNDKLLLTSGATTDSNIEAYAVSAVENWSINVITLDKNCFKIDDHLYDVENPTKTIILIKIEDFYCLKI